MIAEYPTCIQCPLMKHCSNRLEPELINPNNHRIINIHSQGKGFYGYLDCRHFTCDQNGSRSATNQLNLMQRGVDNFEVVYDDGTTEILEGRTFYSTEKQTPTRFVDRSGYIYSMIDVTMPDIGYAYTGRRVTQSDILTEALQDRNHIAPQKEIWLKFINRYLLNAGRVPKAVILDAVFEIGISKQWGREIIDVHANCIREDKEGHLSISREHRDQVNLWYNKKRDLPDACTMCQTSPLVAKTRCPILFE
jgi:hypothetical protein